MEHNTVLSLYSDRYRPEHRRLPKMPDYLKIWLLTQSQSKNQFSLHTYSVLYNVQSTVSTLFQELDMRHTDAVPEEAGDKPSLVFPEGTVDALT